jgi:hypothetical protein
VRAGNRRAAASRPACGTSIARLRPPHAQPSRANELRTWGRPRRGCGRRRLAPSWPALFRALDHRDIHELRSTRAQRPAQPSRVLGGQAFARLHHSTAHPFDFTRCVDGKCCVAARFPLAAGAAQAARPPPTTRAAAARSSQGAASASPCAAAPTRPPPCSWVRRLKTPPHRTSQGSNIQSPASARESRYSLPSAASGMAERRALFARGAPFRTGPMQRRLPVSRPRRAAACRASPARVAPRRCRRAPPPTARAAAPALRDPAPPPPAATRSRGGPPPARPSAAASLRRRPAPAARLPPGDATRPVSSPPLSELRIQNHVLPGTSRFKV